MELLEAGVLPGLVLPPAPRGYVAAEYLPAVLAAVLGGGGDASPSELARSAAATVDRRTLEAIAREDPVDGPTWTLLARLADARHLESLRPDWDGSHASLVK
jgi:hypothetical protein